MFDDLNIRAIIILCYLKFVIKKNMNKKIDVQK